MSDPGDEFFFACVLEYERSQAGDTNRRFLYVFCQDLTKWIALCSPCQAASSSSVGMKKLRELKEFVAVEGKDRLDSELEGLSRDVLRQVSQAADLPVKVSGQTLTASELRHALLGVLIPSEEQGGGCFAKISQNGLPCVLHVRQLQAAVSG